MNKIYFDNNSTTRVDNRVLESMLPYYTSIYGNPSSLSHDYGIKAFNGFEKSLNIIADYFGMESIREIIITSGATEANNTVLYNMLSNNDVIPHIIVSSIEHSSILNTCKFLEHKNLIECSYIQVDKSGIVDVDYLKSSIKQNTKLISIMFANNEIGTIQPIYEIGTIAHNHNILFHTDATQYIPTNRLDVSRLPVDIFSFSAHKFHGPKGIGGLYWSQKIPTRFSPLIVGGGQQNGFRSGTINVPAVVGMATAINILNYEIEENNSIIQQVKDTLINTLNKRSVIFHINGHRNSIINNLNLTFANVSSLKLLSLMPEVSFSTHSACMGVNQNSYVLKEIGLSSDAQKNTVRFGFSKYNTIQEAEIVANRIADIISG